MNKFNYKNLTPFKWFVLENFPFIEADFDALTNWQLFCKIGKEINKIINSVNLTGEQIETLTNAFNDLQDYVNNYFTNLNIQNEINNKLDQMAEDGTLANIINQEIFGELNNNINNLQIGLNNVENSIDLLNKIKSYNYLGLNRVGRTLCKIADTPYNYMQGNCLTEEGIFVRGLVGGTDDTINKVKLQKINLSTMTVINEVILERGGHCNYISYNPKLNELYVTPLKDKIEGNEVTNNNIVVVDYNTFQLKRYITLPTNDRIYSFIYDKVTDKYYVINIDNVIFNYDFDNNTLSQQCVLDFKNTPEIDRLDAYKGYKLQGATIHNNIIYYSSMNPYGMGVFNLNGECINFFNYPRLIDERYLIREVEQISISDDNEIYIGTCGQECYTGEYTMFQVFKGNISHNTGDLFPVFNPISPRTIHVNANSNSINPNGASDNPFKTIGEALDGVNSMYFENADISVAEGNYPFVYINLPGKKIKIEGTESNYSNIIVNGIRVIKSDVILRRMKITDLFTKTKALSPISSSSANVSLRNINFEMTEARSIIYISYTNLIFESILANGTSIDMFTNKQTITARQNSRINCLDEISPLYVFEDDNVILENMCRFCAQFQHYYGEKIFPDEFFNMLASKAVKKLILEVSSATTANENILQEFKINGLTGDSFRISITRISNYNEVYVMCADVNINTNDKQLTMSGNKRANLKTDTYTSKEDNTSTSYYASLFNIYLQ